MVLESLSSISSSFRDEEVRVCVRGCNIVSFLLRTAFSQDRYDVDGGGYVDCRPTDNGDDDDYGDCDAQMVSMMTCTICMMGLLVVMF